MKKKQSMSQRVRTMLATGATNKAIIDKVKCSPQLVYSLRYKYNKETGLAALSKGTGITVTTTSKPKRKPKEKHIPARAPSPQVYTVTDADLADAALWKKREEEAFKRIDYINAIYREQDVAPRKSFWQRVKDWFTK